MVLPGAPFADAETTWTTVAPLPFELDLAAMSSASAAAYVDVK